MIRGTLKRALAGVLAGLIVVSSVSSGVFADENNPAEPYPMLETVRGSLDSDEIVTAEDLTLPYGTGFDAGSDLTGITIPDPGKVHVSFSEAKDDSGVDLMTDRAGTYHAKYHVDVMSGHPSYSIMRNITVELFKPPVHEEEGADDESDIPGTLPRDEESEDAAPAEEEAAGTTSEETVQDASEGTESEASPAESEEGIRLRMVSSSVFQTVISILNRRAAADLTEAFDKIVLRIKSKFIGYLGDTVIG